MYRLILLHTLLTNWSTARGLANIPIFPRAPLNKGLIYDDMTESREESNNVAIILGDGTYSCGHHNPMSY